MDYDTSHPVKVALTEEEAQRLAFFVDTHEQCDEADRALIKRIVEEQQRALIVALGREKGIVSTETDEDRAQRYWETN